jgi:hypothetical protein
MSWLPTLVGAALLLATSAALAAPCPPTVALTGDPDLIASVAEVLAAHGVAAATPACPGIQARLGVRAGFITVDRIGPDDVTRESRMLAEPATVASVIESWTRLDLEEPLLAVHPIPPPDPRDEITRPPTRVAARDVQVFGAMEASFADDLTSWMGVVVGVCVEVDSVCVSARGRFATIASGAGLWSQVERHSQDALIGGDIPFRVGPATMTFGFGAGMGSVHTGLRENGAMQGSETFGLRADVHLAWSLPIARHLALDVSASLDGAQVTDVESTRGQLANEPHVFGRLGAGLRYGAR